MSKLLKNEDGLAIVEATILLPVCMLIVIALYYASIFLCQRANLQANLQTALIYYKNVESDTYVEAKEQMQFQNGDGTVGAVGSSYGSTSKLFPYRFFGMKFREGNFKSLFQSICGHMFFDTGDNVSLSVKSTNYVVYKKITATAAQTVQPAISLAMVGGPDEMTICATGESIITDADDFIRNTDFAVDLISNTALGAKIGDLADTVVGYYNKFKEKLHIGS